MNNGHICKIRNARFLDIGRDFVIGGTTEGHPDLQDGSTIYTAPILADDGEFIRTKDGSYSYVRTH